MILNIKYINTSNYNFFSAAGEIFLKNDRNQRFLYRNNVFNILFYVFFLIKSHQNFEKFSFSMTYINFLSNSDRNRNKKKSKTIQRDLKILYGRNSIVFYKY